MIWKFWWLDDLMDDLIRWLIQINFFRWFDWKLECHEIKMTIFPWRFPWGFQVISWRSNGRDMVVFSYQIGQMAKKRPGWSFVIRIKRDATTIATIPTITITIEFSATHCNSYSYVILFFHSINSPNLKGTNLKYFEITHPS